MTTKKEEAKKVERKTSLPDILFTEHGLFLLFLFGTFGHLDGERQGGLK